MDDGSRDRQSLCHAAGEAPRSPVGEFNQVDIGQNGIELISLGLAAVQSRSEGEILSRREFSVDESGMADVSDFAA